MSKIRRSFLKLIVFLSLTFSSYSFCAEEKIEEVQKLEKKEEVETVLNNNDYSFVLNKFLDQKRVYDKIRSENTSSVITREIIFLTLALCGGSVSIAFCSDMAKEKLELPHAVAVGTAVALIVYCLSKFGWKVTATLWNFITCNKGKEITNLTSLNNFVRNWKINKISTPKELHDFFEELYNMLLNNGGKLNLGEEEAKSAIKDVVGIIKQFTQNKPSVALASVLS